jgi:hypothetical protein
MTGRAGPRQGYIHPRCRINRCAAADCTVCALVLQFQKRLRKIPLAIFFFFIGIIRDLVYFFVIAISENIKTRCLFSVNFSGWSFIRWVVALVWAVARWHLLKLFPGFLNAVVDGLVQQVFDFCLQSMQRIAWEGFHSGWIDLSSTHVAGPECRRPSSQGPVDLF